jgi:hypothetical protein
MVGVAASYSNWTESQGALIQLAVNLMTIVAAGIVTLLLQRWAYARRKRSSD